MRIQESESCELDFVSPIFLSPYHALAGLRLVLVLGDLKLIGLVCLISALV